MQFLCDSMVNILRNAAAENYSNNSMQQQRIIVIIGMQQQRIIVCLLWVSQQQRIVACDTHSRHTHLVCVTLTADILTCASCCEYHMHVILYASATIRLPANIHMHKGWPAMSAKVYWGAACGAACEGYWYSPILTDTGAQCPSPAPITRFS